MNAISTILDGREIQVTPRAEPLPQNELKRLSEDVLYNVESFSAYQILASFYGDHDRNLAPRRSDAWWFGQALLTSFLMCARQVEDFVYPEISAHDESDKEEKEDGIKRVNLGIGHNRTTLTSYDYVEDASAWVRERPPRPEDFQALRRRVNRAVIHLDTGRLSTNLHEEHDPVTKKQVWTIADYWNGLLPALRVFRKQVTPRLLCEGFIYYFDDALRCESAKLDWLETFPFFLRDSDRDIDGEVG